MPGPLRAPPRRGTTPLVATVALALASPPSLHAFEYTEHCRVSNDALTIAVAEARTAGLDDQGARWVEDRTHDPCEKASAPSDPSSYGKWVGLADFAVQATDLYVHEENARAWQQVEQGEIPEELVSSLGRSWLRGLLASHLNEEHFQDRALFAHWLWHRQAVRLAADGKLASALFLNAYADHFLEDAFAPGHVMTPRRELHDVPALAMHDHYNRVGDHFHPTRTKELAALVANQPRLACEHAGWCNEAPLAPHLASLEQSGILMKGDGRLLDEREKDRRLIVTLTVARSALDVLASYAARSPVNRFDRYTWSAYSRTAAGSRLRTPQAGTPFGEYRARETRGLLAFDPALGVSAGTEAFLTGVAPPTRWRVGAEVLVGGTPGGRWLYDSGLQRLIPQLGLTLAYDFHKASGLSGHSLGVRLVKPITQLDLQLSAVVRHTWYRFGPDDARTSAFEWGGRFELGFGLVFLGIGVERVAMPDASTGRARSTSVTAQLSVYPPRMHGWVR